MATNVYLTPELEAFARTCVDGGKFNSVSEVARAGLRLLQDGEERRRSFNAMLDAVRDKSAGEGAVAVDTVLAEMDEFIDQSGS